MWEEQYKNHINQIHAPKDLVERIRVLAEQEMLQENSRKDQQKTAENTKHTHYFAFPKWSIAACIVVLLVSGVGYYRVNNTVHMDTKTMTGFVQIENQLSFGKHEASNGIDANQKENNKTEEHENLSETQYPEKNILLKKLWTVQPSKMAGQTVFLGEDTKNHIFYAGYKTKGGYSLITGKKMTEKEFIKSVMLRIKEK